MCSVVARFLIFWCVFARVLVPVSRFLDLVFFWASYVNLGSIVCGMCFADFADFVLQV